MIAKENQEMRNDFSSTERGSNVSEAKLWDVNEVAQYLGLVSGSIYHLVSARKIPVIKISSRCIRFSKKSIDDWLSLHSHPSHAKADCRK